MAKKRRPIREEDVRDLRERDPDEEDQQAPKTRRTTPTRSLSTTPRWVMVAAVVGCLSGVYGALHPWIDSSDSTIRATKAIASEALDKAQHLESRVDDIESSCPCAQ